jgi:fluoroquinolone transport system permease protein
MFLLKLLANRWFNLMKKLLRFDILLQWRQGFWLIYFIITLIYLAILFNVPKENRYFMSMFLILTDTSMLGIIFIGALVLLEKQQNVQQALCITPLRTEKYIISKTLSLTLLSFIMSSLLLFLPNKFHSGFWIVLIAIVLTSILFTLFGIGISAKAKTINGYMAGIMAGSMGALLPIIPYVVLDRPFWLTIFPINATIDLLWNDDSAAIRIVSSIIMLVLWSFLAFKFSLQQYRLHVLK